MPALSLNGPVVSYVINPPMITARCDGCVREASGIERWTERERQEGREGEGVCCEEGSPGARLSGQHGPSLMGCAPERGAAILFLRQRKNVSRPSQASLASSACSKDLLWEPPGFATCCLWELRQVASAVKCRGISSSRIQGGHE